MKGVVFKSVLAALVIGFILYEYLSFPDVSPLKKRNPRTTALMDLRDEQFRSRGMRPGRQQVWVPYDSISEHLKKAILLSEDASFFSHNGVDFYELKEAAKRDWQKGEFARGGSTITMQLARNLYLNPSKNPLRKVREVIIAFQLERELSKRRIFELYLNVVEWGRGIYGAEAASRHYLGKPVSALDPADAATLAALLPSPLNPREKSLLYRRNLILKRMAATNHISAAEADRQSRRPLFYRGEEPPPPPEEEKSIFD
ncbi:MAG TPA: monofunctional biosynthetic peptidoglycan transglycosylase [Candidatus Binatia bacterium]|nr:monofunctional biosynthetic peptidoglycan transglycosylase [Candidatus Binatia bacterium]